jgi:sugar lactone lactonase YvrE
MVLTARPCSATLVEHAEGPFWDGKQLGWVDILAGRLWLARDSGSALADERCFDIGRPLGAAVPAQGGGWLLAAGVGFAYLAPDGTLRELADSKNDPQRIRMNDGKCDPAGRFWAGTMAYDQTPGAGALYRLDLDGSLDTVLSGVTISNGLGWSPDHSIVYYIDSGTGGVDAFDYDQRDGSIHNRRALVRIPNEEGMPDGMAVDDEGCLWVALWGGSAVRRYDPLGRHIGTVKVPASHTSSCCFGAGTTLFITTSRLDLSPERLAAEPDAGRVFRVDVGVGGPSATPYRGPTEGRPIHRRFIPPLE